MRKSLWWTLVMVLLAGLIYRLAFLGFRQLWIDEILQAIITRAISLPEMMMRLRDAQSAPAPLDYLAQKAVITILGETAWTLRLHAAVFGTLSLWFFFRLARLVFTARVAVYATFLFSFYPLHHHYSQEGRPYSLLVLFTLICYERLFRLVQAKNLQTVRFVELGLGLLFVFYTSFLGILLILSQWVALVISAVTRQKHGETICCDPVLDLHSLPPARWSLVLWYSLTAVTALLIFLPWIAFAWERPSVAAPNAIADPKLAIRLFKELGDNSYPMSGLIFIGAILGTLALQRNHRQQTSLWLWSWFLIPIPALLLIQLSSGYFFAIRHILHLTPPLILLAGYGVCHFGSKIQINGARIKQLFNPVALYAGSFLVTSLIIAGSHTKREPIDWRGASEFLRVNVSSDQKVLMPHIYPLIEFYSPNLEHNRAPFENLDELGPNRLNDVSYVVCADEITRDPCTKLRSYLTSCKMWRTQKFKGIVVFCRADRNTMMDR